ncbi:Translin [Ephemerocybe angulata]|uniref:Translin n=1 Tax=Ephemerocybe angulata TaxID=980116 RepID=A0A8H6IKN3_9AGAR|nr:Translin [Tulosesus angulatus]
MASSDIRTTFQSFRDDIDAYNDRRERLIKASRDITNLSKKTIFLLHRLVLENAESLDDREVYLAAAKKGYEKLREVQNAYAGLRAELEADMFWRYERQVSPGLQEYIEALSFAWYLEHGSLIPFSEVQKSISDSDGKAYFPLTVADYLLGLSDLTGELMRFAISGLSRKGGRKKAMEVCAFVRTCKADFDRFTPFIYELRKKQSVTTQSLEKIEDTVYAICVRSSEYDLPPEMLDDIVGSISQSSRSKRGDEDEE